MSITLNRIEKGVRTFDKISPFWIWRTNLDLLMIRRNQNLKGDSYVTGLPTAYMPRGEQVTCGVAVPKYEISGWRDHYRGQQIVEELYNEIVNTWKHKILDLREERFEEDSRRMEEMVLDRQYQNKLAAIANKKSLEMPEVSKFQQRKNERENRTHHAQKRLDERKVNRQLKEVARGFDDIFREYFG